MVALAMNTGIPVREWLQGNPDHLEIALDLWAEAQEKRQ